MSRRSDIVPASAHNMRYAFAAITMSLLLGAMAHAVQVEGVMPRQVFQRSTKSEGSITFRFTDNTGAGSASLTGKDFDSTRAVEGQAGAITFDRVPVGGPYTLTIGGQTFSDLYMGELWIISGQSNAFGYCYDADEKTRKGPMPGVHMFIKHGNIAKAHPPSGNMDEQMAAWREWVAEFEWMEAEDPLFWRNKQNNGPWVTAAQEFYKATGVPVGVMGHAQGGRPLQYFMSLDEKDMRFLKPIVQRAGRHAARYLWYQGEGDAYVRYNPNYRSRFGAMVDAIRRYTGNADLTVGIVQLSKFQNVYAQDRIGLSRNAYAEMRELQRDLALETDHAVLFSTVTAQVKNAGVHLTAASYVKLGEQIAHVFIRQEKAGTLVPAGPQPHSVRFADAERRTIVVQFTGAGDGLRGGDSADQWAVYDNAHPPGIDGWFSVNTVDKTGKKTSRPVPCGYAALPREKKLHNAVQPSVPIQSVAVDSAGRQVTITLSEPAGDGATLSYAYISHILGTLTNAEGYPAPGFTYIPIPSDHLDTQPRDPSVWLKPTTGQPAQ